MIRGVAFSPPPLPRRSCRALLVLLVVLSCTWRAAAENWPQFRGPTGQGHSSTRNLPVSWSRSRNVRWVREIPGKGWSSPIFNEGRIYLTTAVPVGGEGDAADQSLRALCLDGKTGETRWDVEVFHQDASGTDRIHRKNSHASPTPLTDGEFLYVHFGALGTACLDLDGKVIWRNRELRYTPVHGNGGSPVLEGRNLILSCDGRTDPFVVALDRRDGRVRWKTPRPPSSGKLFSFSTPLVIEVDGRKQVVSPGSNLVASYDPVDGREIWRVRYPGGYSVVPRPVHGHGLVFVCTGYDSPTLLAIRTGGRGDVTDSHVAWRLSRGAPHNPSPLLVGDELYVVSDGGIASCVDARSGKSHWRERLGGAFSASPIHVDGKIYFQSEEGEGVVIEAGRRYREISRNPLGELGLASLAIGDGALFIRTRSRLYRIDSAAR